MDADKVIPGSTVLGFCVLKDGRKLDLHTSTSAGSSVAFSRALHEDQRRRLLAGELTEEERAKVVQDIPMVIRVTLHQSIGDAWILRQSQAKEDDYHVKHVDSGILISLYRGELTCPGMLPQETEEIVAASLYVCWPKSVSESEESAADQEKG